MKKIVLIVTFIILLSGCTNIKNASYDDIINIIAMPTKKANVYRTGNKFHLPREMKITKSKLCNEVLSDKNNIYYLYIDLISYHNKIKNHKEINKESYYSKNIKSNNKEGYVDIKLLKNGKYFIEIMYNYAKIEVIVDEKDIKEVLLNSINILNSIKYTDDVIANLLNKDNLNYIEEEYNIFNTTSSDSTIQIDYNYHEMEDEIVDTDLIN